MDTYRHTLPPQVASGRAGGRSRTLRAPIAEPPQSFEQRITGNMRYLWLPTGATLGCRAERVAESSVEIGLHSGCS